MKIMSVYKLHRDALAGPPSEKEMAAMGALIVEMQQKGVLVDTGGVFPGAVSMRVQRSGGTVTVTDGPFTESKEVIGGFAVLEVNTREEAIAWTKRFLEITGDAACEMQEVGATP